MSALNPDHQPNKIVENSLRVLLQKLYKDGNIDELVRQQILRSPDFARLTMLLGIEVVDEIVVVDSVEIFEDQHQK